MNLAESTAASTPDEVSSRAWEKETDGLRARRESRRRLETAMLVLPERVYLRVEGVRFAKFLNLPSWMPNCWGLFFLDLPNKKMMPNRDAQLLKMLNFVVFGKMLISRFTLIDRTYS